MLALLAEIWLWVALGFLLGVLIGKWIWDSLWRTRYNALEADLASANKTAQDATTARARLEKELAESNAKISPLMTANTNLTAEAERLKRELDISKQATATCDTELSRYRAAASAAAATATAMAAEKLPTFLDRPRGVPDDLRLIKGVGEKLNHLLTSIGIFHFRQIANWHTDEVAMVDAKMDNFKGRIERDHWIDQAKLLAAGKHDEFEAKFGKMGENN